MKQKARQVVAMDADSVVPKYRQMVDSLTAAIREGRMKRGDVLPTISDVCETHSLARLTVLKAYRLLQRQGIIRAEKRKGYYVATESIEHTVRVFLLFDEFTMYKRILYNAFRERLGERASIDIYFHHYNVALFDSLVSDRAGRYGMYVIMPWPEKRILPVLKRVDRQSLLLLDRGDAVPRGFAHVVQDHGPAMVHCLEQALPQLRKYRQFVLVYPEDTFHPAVTVEAFRAFCARWDLNGDVCRNLAGRRILPDTAYFCVDDNELVQVVEHCREVGYRLGQDVGVLSYNDTPMKKIIANGITVISTDFARMGARAADLVLDPEKDSEVIPTALILRASL